MVKSQFEINGEAQFLKGFLLWKILISEKIVECNMYHHPALIVNNILLDLLSPVLKKCFKVNHTICS